MSPDTTKLDHAAERCIDADAAAAAAKTKAADAKMTAEIAAAQLRGAAAEHAALHGGRPRLIAEQAVARVTAKLAAVKQP